jgi:hypothetical protein
MAGKAGVRRAFYRMECAMTEATFVFRHADETEARRFCKELFASYPFGGDGPTNVVACSVGDAMSVQDAVRAILECRVLGSFEREECALAMCECLNWDDVQELAAKWEIRWENGEFVEGRVASAIEAATAGETGNTDSTEGESATREAGDAQT